MALITPPSPCLRSRALKGRAMLSALQALRAGKAPAAGRLRALAACLAQPDAEPEALVLELQVRWVVEPPAPMPAPPGQVAATPLPGPPACTRSWWQLVAAAPSYRSALPLISIGRIR